MADREPKKPFSSWEAVKRVLPFVVIPSVIAVAAISADLAGTPIQRVNAEVLSMADTWELKNGNRCRIELKTDLGPASLFIHHRCSAVSWTAGSRPRVDVRIGRISGQLGVMHNSGDVPSACCVDYSLPLLGASDPYFAPRPGDAPRTFLPNPKF
jgi:hypothetical protein